MENLTIIWVLGIKTRYMYHGDPYHLEAFSPNLLDLFWENIDQMVRSYHNDNTVLEISIYKTTTRDVFGTRALQLYPTIICEKEMIPYGY